MSNMRNIIIFLGLAAVFVSIYIIFIQESGPESNLVSSSNATTQNASTVSGGTQNVIAENFLSLLLNIKNIKLDDSIFSDKAFASLRDSSIILVPDNNSGRPNPFAQFGSDSSAVPASTTPSTTSGTTPAATPTLSVPVKPTSDATPVVPPPSTTPTKPATPSTITP